jgi:two-component system, LytTR family, sensor kinase
LHRINKRFLVIFLCATFLGVLYSARGIFISVSLGRSIDWVRQVGFEFMYWYVWAAFTPVVFWFARRFEITRATWRTILALISFGLLIAPLQAVIEYGIAYSIDVIRHMPQAELARRRQTIPRLMAIEAFSNFIIYSIIVCGHYAYDYYLMYREREMRALELEGRLTQAELQNLKMQLHPHFLFNTLHTISVLMMRNVTAANQMLIRLSDLLRVTLDNAGTQEVTLKQELDFLDGYLEIEKTRFHDRLTVKMEIDPTTLDINVPNLLLQPMVENAIRHGIGNRPAAGSITIRSHRQGNRLHLEISDNGPGLPKQKFKKGVGITNSEARLKQLYGSNHSFELRQAPEGGLLVRIAIPINDEPPR